MRRWTLLFVCLAGVLAAAGPHGQTIGARALTIVPDSANTTADWATIVDRMVRGNELRVRLERGDTVMTGRSVEQLTQYYRGLQVWGGSVARQFDGTSLVSVFGTIYQGLDIDVAPAVSRDAAGVTIENQGGTLLLPDTEPELVVLPDGGSFQLA